MKATRNKTADHTQGAILGIASTRDLTGHPFSNHGIFQSWLRKTQLTQKSM